MDGRYVGIDLHRRRSVIYTMDADGEKVDCVRIANDALGLLEQVGQAGTDCEVVIEATYGWYWAVDLLRDAGFSVHLSHPSGNDWGNRRVKNDERDARDLADLLRLGRLAEAWIAPTPPSSRPCDGTGVRGRLLMGPFAIFPLRRSVQGHVGGREGVSGFGRPDDGRPAAQPDSCPRYLDAGQRLPMYAYHDARSVRGCVK